MIVTKRTQGRPPRSSGVNGRERLIEATRIYLRSNRKMSVTRTEIAQGCGVTPALISYYFKDKRSLLDAVTKPLLRSYHSRLRGILAVQGTAADRMLHLIRLLIELNTADAFLVDHVLRRRGPDELDAEDRVAVQAFTDVIGSLIQDLLAIGAWRVVDPVLAEAALWGLCRALGELARHAAQAANRDEVIEATLVEAQVAFVYATFEARHSSVAPPSQAMLAF